MLILLIQDDQGIKFKRAATPGPGRYNPKVEPVKLRPPSYFLGEKTEKFAIKLKVGTDEKVGPGRYTTEGKYTSKHTVPPTWSVPKQTRKPLVLNTPTKNQTYYMYSAMGNQVMSKKRTEVINSIGRENKNTMKRGIFSAHMSFRPTPIRINHPKI